MQRKKSTTLANGLAIFSMFFGAGNVIFPLVVGQNIGANLWMAIAGLLITAVLIPFSGLLSISLANGNYNNFFYKLGRIPGFCIIVLILSLIGPIAGIPRCITLTCSTLQVYFPQIDLPIFSLISCALIYLLNRQRSRMMSVIGVILTPVMLFFMGWIIIQGMLHPRAIEESNAAITNPFLYGLLEGYNTMDLLGAFFFATLISHRVRASVPNGSTKDFIKAMIKSCAIGAVFLSVMYIGFSSVASKYSLELEGIPMDRLLGTLGEMVLGAEAGLFVSMSVALACLTTAMALTAVAADFIEESIFKNKISHTTALMMVLSVSWIVSLLKFGGIVAYIAPLLSVLYPFLVLYSMYFIVVSYNKGQQAAIA